MEGQIGSLANGVALVKHELDCLDESIRHELIVSARVQDSLIATQKELQIEKDVICKLNQLVSEYQSEEQDLETCLCFVRKQCKATGRKRDTFKDEISVISAKLQGLVEAFEASSLTFAESMAPSTWNAKQDDIAAQESELSRELTACREKLEENKAHFKERKAKAADLKLELEKATEELSALQAATAKETLAASALQTQVERASRGEVAAARQLREMESRGASLAAQVKTALECLAKQRTELEDVGKRKGRLEEECKAKEDRLKKLEGTLAALLPDDDDDDLGSVQDQVDSRTKQANQGHDAYAHPPPRSTGAKTPAAHNGPARTPPPNAPWGQRAWNRTDFIAPEHSGSTWSRGDAAGRGLNGHFSHAQTRSTTENRAKNMFQVRAPVNGTIETQVSIDHRSANMLGARSPVDNHPRVGTSMEGPTSNTFTVGNIDGSRSENAFLTRVTEPVAGPTELEGVMECIVVEDEEEERFQANTRAGSGPLNPNPRSTLGSAPMLGPSRGGSVVRYEEHVVTQATQPSRGGPGVVVVDKAVLVTEVVAPGSFRTPLHPLDPQLPHRPWQQPERGLKPGQNAWPQNQNQHQQPWRQQQQQHPYWQRQQQQEQPICSSSLQQQQQHDQPSRLSSPQQQQQQQSHWQQCRQQQQEQPSRPSSLQVQQQQQSHWQQGQQQQQEQPFQPSSLQQQQQQQSRWQQRQQCRQEQPPQPSSTQEQQQQQQQFLHQKLQQHQKEQLLPPQRSLQQWQQQQQQPGQVIGGDRLGSTSNGGAGRLGDSSSADPGSAHTQDRGSTVTYEKNKVINQSSEGRNSVDGTVAGSAERVTKSFNQNLSIDHAQGRGNRGRYQAGRGSANADELGFCAAPGTSALIESIAPQHGITTAPTNELPKVKGNQRNNRGPNTATVPMALLPQLPEKQRDGSNVHQHRQPSDASGVGTAHVLYEKREAADTSSARAKYATRQQKPLNNASNPDLERANKGQQKPSRDANSAGFEHAPSRPTKQPRRDQSGDKPPQAGRSRPRGRGQAELDPFGGQSSWTSL